MRARWSIVVIAAVSVFVVASLANRRRSRPRRRFHVPPPIVPPPPPEEIVREEGLRVIPAEALEADPDAILREVDEAEIERMRDSGELYGAHTPPAVDRTHPEDDRAQEEGENWLEVLAEDAIESGPEPERRLEFLDEEDLDHPSTDTADRPIADRGSAGPRGV